MGCLGAAVCVQPTWLWAFLSKLCFFMADARGVGVQPTWQEIELSGSLLALLFHGCSVGGCAANVAGEPRFQHSPRLVFPGCCNSPGATNVVLEPFLPLLDFVFSRSPRSEQPTWRENRVFSSSPRFVFHGCLASKVQPTWLGDRAFEQSSCFVFSWLRSVTGKEADVVGD